MSKHSMRCAPSGRPSASRSATSRASCVAAVAHALRDREQRVLARHVEPHAALAVRRGHHADVLQLHRLAGADDRAAAAAARGSAASRNASITSSSAPRLPRSREEAAVADVAAAADHHQVDARDRAFDGARDDVGVDAAVATRRTGAPAARERADLVAVGGGLLVAPRLGGCVHLLVQVADHLVLAAFEEQHRVAHVLGVGLAARSCRRTARCSAGSGTAGTAASGSRTPCPRRCAAGTPSAGAGCSRAPRTRAGTARSSGCFRSLAPRWKPRRGNWCPGEHEVRIGLVVAEQDVVARREALDQVVLEQQRLALGARDRHFHRGAPAASIICDARARRLLLEVRRDALLQVARLADVERLARRVRTCGRRRADSAIRRRRIWGRKPRRQDRMPLI